MKAHKNQFRYISILLLIMLLSLCGCANRRPVVDEAYIEAELQERYGIEFVCDSLKYSQYMYKAVCHPNGDVSMSFTCMYGTDGSLGYDNYVGAIIAKEESDSFSDYIGDGLGESFSKCAYVLLIVEDDNMELDGNLEICEMIKDNSFSIKKAYEINPIDSLFFRIYINDQQSFNDYGMEYDTIECAVNKMVSKYKDLYGLNIYLDMDIYFLNDQDYKSMTDYYNGYDVDINDIYNRASLLSLQMGDSTDHHITEDLWLSREEYIIKREGMIQ